MSWQWMDFYMALEFGLGTSVARLRVPDHRVDHARNAIVAEALRVNASYVLFLGDDVLAPTNLFHLLHRHREMMVTGVYWTKTYPAPPYLWNGLMAGPYLDWKIGEYFPIDWAGCDALLVHTDLFKAIEPPWFSCEYVNEPGGKGMPLATEDLYFYTKARAAGFQLYVDTEAQCDHQDRQTGHRFGLTWEMPQAQKDAPHGSTDPVIEVAELGAGLDSPWHGANARTTRFDIRPEVKPDVRCDVRAIPRDADSYDVVSASHLLEHFPAFEAPTVVHEWLRILRPGGQLKIVVPNVEWAAAEILKARDDPAYVVPEWAAWALNGKQDGSPGELHRAVYSDKGLRRLLELVGGLEIEIQPKGDGRELVATCSKRKSEVFAIGPALREAEAREHRNGHGPTEPAADETEAERVTRETNEAYKRRQEAACQV